MGKRILYIGNFKIESRNAAGKRVLNNAKLFSELGYNVYLISLDAGNTSESISTPVQIYDNIMLSKYPEKILASKSRTTISFCKLYDSFVRQNEEFELIITYGSVGLSITNLYIIHKAKKNGAKVIADVVDWLKPDSGTLFSKIIKSCDINFRMKIINKKYDGLIVISNYLKNYYKRYYNSNVIIIPPLSDVSNKKVEVITSGIQIVYAGIPFSVNSPINDYRLMKDRFDLIVDLLSNTEFRNCNFFLHVYGFTYKQLIYSLPALKEKIMTLKGKVIFHGLTPMNEIENKLLKTDYTILIRDCNRLTSAGFPTKVVESISYGVPVITTKQSDIEMYLQDGENAFFIDLNDSDYHLAIEKMKYLININATERLKMKENIIKSNPFYYRKFMRKMKRFLNSIGCI